MDRSIRDAETERDDRRDADRDDVAIDERIEQPADDDERQRSENHTAYAQIAIAVGPEIAVGVVAFNRKRRPH